MRLTNDLSSGTEALARDYDCVLFDLDGVLYVGPDAVPGAASTLDQLRTKYQSKLGFVTNNASRSVDAVADHLTELGIAAQPQEVISSAQVAAVMLGNKFSVGSKVFVLGSPELARLVNEIGLVATQDATDEVVAIVNGYWPQMTWEMISVGSSVISRGVYWLATNLDYTIPTKTGIGPGNGAFVDLLSRVTGRQPDEVAGKPAEPMMTQALSRLAATRALMVGDRLDTDIEAANRIHIDSLLVLSGVTDLAQLLDAAPELRPTFLAHDVSGLLDEHEELVIHPDSVACGEVTLDGDGVIQVLGSLAEGIEKLSPQQQIQVIRCIAFAYWAGRLTRDQALAALPVK
jgi:HAD superfamily hydrolase (TIGR01450 family)